MTFLLIRRQITILTIASIACIGLMFEIYWAHCYNFGTGRLSPRRHPSDRLATIDHLLWSRRCHSGRTMMNAEQVLVFRSGHFVLIQQIAGLHKLKLLISIDIAIRPALVLHLEHLVLQIVNNALSFV